MKDKHATSIEAKYNNVDLVIWLFFVLYLKYKMNNILCLKRFKLEAMPMFKTYDLDCFKHWRSLQTQEKMYLTFKVCSILLSILKTNVTKISIFQIFFNIFQIFLLDFNKFYAMDVIITLIFKFTTFIDEHPLLV